MIYALEQEHDYMIARYVSSWLITTSGSLISSLYVINTVCWGTNEGFLALIYAVSYLPLFTLFAGVLIDYFVVFIIDKIL